MARTAIQNDLSQNKVAKLSYSVRGPYKIICNTRFGNYLVRKLNTPDSPELKFMAYDLYPLLPPLKLCKSVDSIYTRYLNQTHTPLVSSLKKEFDIDLYNEKWLKKPFKLLLPKLFMITIL